MFQPAKVYNHDIRTATELPHCVQIDSAGQAPETCAWRCPQQGLYPTNDAQTHADTLACGVWACRFGVDFRAQAEVSELGGRREHAQAHRPAPTGPALVSLEPPTKCRLVSNLDCVESRRLA
eukprot:2571967-Rhodomonas_salina.2